MVTPSDDIRIRVRTEGAEKAQRDIRGVSNELGRMERSTRGTLLPMLGAGVLTAGLAAGLLGLAASSGAAQNALARIASTVEIFLEPFIEALVPLADAFADWFAELSSGQQKLVGIGIVGGLFAGTIVRIIAGVVTLARWFGVLASRILPLLARGLLLVRAALLKVAVAALANPYVAAAVAVVALIALMYLLVTRVQGVQNIFETVGNHIVGFFNNIIASIRSSLNSVIASANQLPGINIPLISGRFRIPTFDIPDVDPQQGFFELRPFEREALQGLGNLAREAGGAIFNTQNNNYFGLSPEETARIGRNQSDTARERARIQGFA